MGAKPSVQLEEQRRICALRHDGWRIDDIRADTGRSPATIHRVLAAAGGLPPRDRRVRPGCLTLAEREEISRGLGQLKSFATIGRVLGRPTPTISREVGANGGRDDYRAWAAERRAHVQARRPKIPRLVSHPELRARVEAMLKAGSSPEQVAHRLRRDHPDDPEMWVSHETIYQSLYVQSRGALRKELTSCLRTGRARRQPRAAARPGPLRDVISISERPPEVEDRAVPGHWEGDLIKGKGNASAVGTLAERFSRFVMLLHLPDGFDAEHVRDAMSARMQELPACLARTVTWDRGSEMARHRDFTVATGLPVFFADPHSPWQRGTNENTNGLLRQYLPKGTDLSTATRADLDDIEAKLNNRPRQTLDWMTPSEKLTEFLALTG